MADRRVDPGDGAARNANCDPFGDITKLCRVVPSAGATSKRTDECDTEGRERGGPNTANFADPTYDAKFVAMRDRPNDAERARLMELEASIKACGLSRIDAESRKQESRIESRLEALGVRMQAMSGQLKSLPKPPPDEDKRLREKYEASIAAIAERLTGEMARLQGLAVEDWNRVFAVNVLGLFLATRAAAPLLKKSPNGCVVNTCSIAGLRPSAQPLPYAASKAAVANLTKTLANALGPEIRVNAVAPGWIEGDWMKRTLAENYDGLMARRAKYTPLKRCCTTEDVADSMLSLILSNRFVTGEIIIVDGGFSSTT